MLPTVRVPDLVGLEVQNARGVGHAAGVVVTSADLDGPPLGTQSWPGLWLVDGQNPHPDEEADRWSTVQISFHQEGGGKAGVREPRLPSPDHGHLPVQRELEG